MPKSGITILNDIPGSGPELKKGDRNFVAGFRYGLEGIRPGGTRQFKASPHLCYRDTEVANIPKNAVLICDIKKVELLA